jgi:ABC-2 type transport system ATP-binding protein
VIIEQGRILRAGALKEIIAGESHELSIVIRAAGGPEPLYRELVQLPTVRQARITGDDVEIQIEGGDDAGSAILSHLVGKGVRIIDFRQKQMDLEDVFMSVTKGEVQ